MPMYSQTTTRRRLAPLLPEPPPKKRWKRRLIFSCLFLLFLLAFSPHSLYLKHVLGHENKPAPTVSLTTSQLASLAGNVNEVINSNPDMSIAVSIVDLNTGSQQNYGLQNPFEAASTGKLITAADFLHHVEEGDDSLTETVNGNTAKYGLQQMIVLSDDNAWAAFNDSLGHDDLQSYADSIGLKDYDASTNTMPARDVAILLQKLYQKILLNASDTQLLLSYMAKANLNGYIGPVVPSDVRFYHKTGLLDDRVHDAAIIDNGKRPIVLVIFTREYNDQDYAGRALIMQRITKSVLQTYSIN
jgi:beta-lactamase class A